MLIGSWSAAGLAQPPAPLEMGSLLSVEQDVSTAGEPVQQQGSAQNTRMIRVTSMVRAYILTSLPHTALDGSHLA